MAVCCVYGCVCVCVCAYMCADVQVSSWFVSAEDVVVPLGVGRTGAALLALYETVHLSANFVTMLAHTQVVSTSGPTVRHTHTHTSLHTVARIIFSLLLFFQVTPTSAAAASLISEFISFSSFLFETTGYVLISV